MIRRRSDGVFYSHCTLGDLVTGADMEYRDMDPDGVMNIIYQWSTDIIDPFQVDACGGHGPPGYSAITPVNRHTPREWCFT